jgi:3-phenylpropionate/cinnamic acid dioxygenase small subunit
VASAHSDPVVRRLVDKDAIVDLVHRYSFLVDHRRYDELVELFTEDCAADYGPGVGGMRNGRAALRSMFGDRFSATSHHNANVIVSFVDGDDDRADVCSSVYAWHRAVDGSTSQIWGMYFDTVVRTVDGWRIAARELRVAGCEGMSVAWRPLLP